MKLHVLSDLHLEFADFIPGPADADVVVLAGDIGKGAHGIGWARATFPDHDIIYVAGNHEFYGCNRLEILAKLRIEARECGVHFLDDEAVVIDGVRFLGTTLWTDFELFGSDDKPWCMKDAGDFMNDFRVIYEGDKVFSPMDSVRLHQKSLAWLEHELQRPFDGKTVVVTHHLPSRQSVAERFQKSALSAAFASNLEHLLGEPAVLWIHGHTHDSMDYEVMGTRVICNPRGYVLSSSGPENFDFDPGLVVEV
jgi:predicted phosphodiesterase